MSGRPPATVSRRGFLASVGLTGAALTAPIRAAGQAPAAPLPSQPEVSPERAARDEAHWRRVAAFYQVTDRVTNLEAGYWGMMASPVLDEYVRHVERVNRENSFYARNDYASDLSSARERVASALGAGVDEVAFTRGATEALQCLIRNYNRLTSGDAVMYADLDYPGMQYAMNWLAGRRGARVVRVVIPEPATRANVLETYASALRNNPGVRLLLLTHVNNKTGLVTPVAEVAALARTHGADAVVDAAHAFGQLAIKAPDIGADFVGFNLHKWIGAPVGAGVMYIRRGRLPDIDRDMGDEDSPPDSITSRVHSGTANFATFLTVPAALDFHAAVGPAFKAARVRYLRDRWVSAVRGVRGIDVLTPDDPGMTAAITSFRLNGRTSKEDNDRIVHALLDRYGIFTVRRNGLERGDCVRVTPALYNTAADVDRLAAALKELAGA
jgi:selenocysteine lyase/cysteine desulfurase